MYNPIMAQIAAITENTITCCVVVRATKLTTPTIIKAAKPNQIT
jgi:hypothetical protein